MPPIALNVNGICLNAHVLLCAFYLAFAILFLDFFAKRKGPEGPFYVYELLSHNAL